MSVFIDGMEYNLPPDESSSFISVMNEAADSKTIDTEDIIALNVESKGYKLLEYTIEDGDTITTVTSSDSEYSYIKNHTAGHVVSQAVTDIYENAIPVRIEQTHEQFSVYIVNCHIGESEIPQIEDRNQKIIDKNSSIQQEIVGYDKMENILLDNDHKKDDIITADEETYIKYAIEEPYYRDICFDPHCMHTGAVGQIYLTSINPYVYDTADGDRIIINKIRGTICEQKQKDHMKILQEMDMLSDKNAMLPRGKQVEIELQDYIADINMELGFKEIRTDIIKSDTSDISEQIDLETSSYLRYDFCDMHKNLLDSEISDGIYEQDTVFRNIDEEYGLIQSTEFTLSESHTYINSDNIMNKLKQYIEQILTLCDNFNLESNIIIESDKESTKEREIIRRCLDDIGCSYDIVEKTTRRSIKIKNTISDIHGDTWDTSFIELKSLDDQFYIHYSPIGSIQRFIALVLETHQGRLPTWIAPEHVSIIPLSEKLNQQVEYIKNELAQVCDVKAFEINDDTTDINEIIHTTTKHRTPYILFITSKEEYILYDITNNRYTDVQLSNFKLHVMRSISERTEKTYAD